MDQTKNGTETAGTVTVPNNTEATQSFKPSIAQTEEIQQRQSLEVLKGIAKAYTAEEWDTIIELIPSRKLAEVLADRATKGEKAYKKIKAIMEET